MSFFLIWTGVIALLRYRLIVLTPNGGISADIAGTKNLAELAGSQFQKIPDASHVLYD